VCTTTNQPDSKSNSNPNPKPTTEHTAVSIQLNIVTCPMYPEKLTQDHVIVPLLLLSIVTTPQPYVTTAK